MAKDAIESLDSQFNSIQHDKAINISSTSNKVPKDKQKIAPMSGVLNQPEVDMDGLMTSMDKLKDKSEESKWHSKDSFTSETKQQIHPDSGTMVESKSLGLFPFKVDSGLKEGLYRRLDFSQIVPCSWVRS